MAAEAVAEDQRKRAMEALERRFALAKAEAQQQQQRSGSNRKRPHEEVKDSTTPVLSSSLRIASDVSSAASASRSNMHKKGPEADDPIYSMISQPLHENLMTVTGLSGQRKDMAQKIIHELFKSGDIAQKYIQGSRSKKFDNWILLDNHVQGTARSASCSRALQNNSKRSKRRMSMNLLKKHGAFELPEEFHKFDTFVPAHQLWKKYVVRLLKISGKDQLAQCLLNADLHGAIMRVTECKVNAYVGVVGIMIRETTQTFGIITQDNKFKVVPKNGSVFLLQADCWKVTLLGDKLVSRNMI